MRTIDDHIADADRWSELLPESIDPSEMTGWRPTCKVLADEVRRLRSECVGPLYLVARIREAVGDPDGRMMQDELVEYCKGLLEQRDAYKAACEAKTGEIRRLLDEKYNALNRF